MNRNKILETLTSQLTPPSKDEIKNDSYVKDEIILHGLKIFIETPEGSFRRGKDWETRMDDRYGYIANTKGADGDELDVYIGPEAHLNTVRVFVIDQIDVKTGKFDEHKVMFGYSDVHEARSAYFRHYELGWKGFGHITEFSISEFKKWLNSDTTKPVLKTIEV